MSQIPGSSKASRKIGPPGVQMTPHLKQAATVGCSDLGSPTSVDTRWFTKGLSFEPKKEPESPLVVRSAAEQEAVHPISTRSDQTTTRPGRNEVVTQQKSTSHHPLTQAVKPSTLTYHEARPIVVESEGWTPPVKEKRVGTDPPLPAPLHVIESALPQDHVHRHKNKLSKHTWSISELGAISNEEGGGPANVLLHDDSQSQEQSQADNDVDYGFVADWLVKATIPSLQENPVTEFINNPASHGQDLDPNTGRLLPATHYPPTLVEDQLEADERLLHNKMSMTSTLQIRRELKSRERVASAIRIQQVDDQERELALENKLEPEPEWPSTDCTLRPASPVHFEQISEIMNLETLQGTCPYLLETKPATAREIRRIFEYCAIHMRPFFVACLEEEDFLDRSKWPKASDKAYLEYVKFKQNQPAKSPVVVGFAFVAESRIGLLNRPCAGSRFTGQIRLIVHPKHRQKLYGTALFDRILLSVAPYHRSLIDYTWRCEDPTAVYELPSAAHNRRLYSHVFVENLSDRDAEMPWKRKLLEKFDFKRIACFEKLLKTDRGSDSQWLDLELWQLRTHTTIIDGTPGQYLMSK